MRKFWIIKFGAVDQNDLEPAPINSILDELEEWSRYIEAEPEIIHKLQVFEKVADGTVDNTKKSSKRSVRSRGPSL